MSGTHDLDAIERRAALIYATAHGTGEGCGGGCPTCTLTGSNVPALASQLADARAELARWQAALDAVRTRHHGAPTEAAVNAVCDEIERLATEPPR